MSKVTGSSSAGSIKRLLYANVVTLCVITFLLCVGPYVSITPSVVCSVKSVVKILCCYLLVVNLVLSMLLMDVELPPYKSRRTTSSKVERAIETSVSFFCHIILLFIDKKQCGIVPK